MAELQFEGGKDRYCLIDQAALSRVQPAAPQTGYNIPVTGYDFSVRQGFERFDELYTSGVPTKPMAALLPVNGTISYSLHYDSAPYWLRHAVADAVTTGAGPDYTHTFTLGDQTNVIKPAFAYEHQQLQALDPGIKYQQIWGCRFNTITLNAAVTGGVVFDCAVEGLSEGVPSSTAIADTVVSVTDDQVDGIGAVLEVDSIASECRVSEFTMELNHRLETDKHPLFCGGERGALPRMNPTVSGTYNVFYNDLTYDEIEDAFADPKTLKTFTYTIAESASRSFEIELTNVMLALQGKPVNGPGGYDCNFSWEAYGDSCMVIIVKNKTASYP